MVGQSLRLHICFPNNFVLKSQIFFVSQLNISISEHDRYSSSR